MFRFDDIGNAIKTFARVLAILEFIAGIVLGFYVAFILENLGLGLVCAAGGALVAYISNMILFAVGQVVDDVHAIREDGIRTFSQPPAVYTRQEVADIESNSEKKASEQGIKY